MKTVGSLFSGFGLGDLGFTRAGWDIRWQVEINRRATRILENHWPTVLRFRDVRDLGPWVPTVDAIIGGFPCKNTSAAAAVHGKRSGLAGPESGLWFEQLRIVSELRPRWAIVENPAGVSAWFPTIQGGLEGLGYGVRRLDLSVWDVGGPHLRRRVFAIAHLDGPGLEVAWQTRSPAVVSDAWRATARNAWLSDLGRVGRVADGSPGRVDRRELIEGLGNGWCPWQAQWIGEWMAWADGLLLARSAHAS